MSDNGPVAAGSAPDVVPVFFLSDSTGISAETMGNALLIQFPDVRFERTLIPFISSIEEAREVVARLDAVLVALPCPVRGERLTWATDRHCRPGYASTSNRVRTAGVHAWCTSWPTVSSPSQTGQ